MSKSIIGIDSNDAPLVAFDALAKHKSSSVDNLDILATKLENLMHKTTALINVLARALINDIMQQQDGTCEVEEAALQIPSRLESLKARYNESKSGNGVYGSDDTFNAYTALANHKPDIANDIASLVSKFQDQLLKISQWQMG